MKSIHSYNLDFVGVRLVKEASILSEEPIRNSSSATKIIREQLSEYDREVFGVLNLDSNGKPINFNIVSIGTLNSSYVHPREVFKSSILANANAIILFHCHPSGNVKPSAEDYATTSRLKEAGDILGIQVIDHIVVGANDSYSFKNHEEL